MAAKVNTALEDVGIDNYKLKLFKYGNTLRNSSYNFAIAKTGADGRLEHETPTHTLKCVNGDFHKGRHTHLNVVSLLSFAVEDSVLQIAEQLYKDQKQAAENHFNDIEENIPRELQVQLKNAQKDIDQLARNILVRSGDPIFQADPYYKDIDRPGLG